MNLHRWPLLLALVSGCVTSPSSRGETCLDTRVLSEALRDAVRAERFEGIVDLGPATGMDTCPESTPGCAWQKTAVGKERFPQMDLAVIAFQPRCPQKVVPGNVLFSRDFPEGKIAEFSAETQNVANIRYRKWNQRRHDGGIWRSPAPQLAPQAWNEPVAPEEILAGSGTDFMSPFPASILKIMVATKVIEHLERSGPLHEGLETRFTFGDLNLTTRQYLESMLQWSGNTATRALIQRLHQWGEIEEGTDTTGDGFPDLPPARNALNGLFAQLGLDTLQMNRTRAATGQWGKGSDNYEFQASSVSATHMTAWDTARLLWLLADGVATGPGEAPGWKVNGVGVKSPLSLEGRRLFWDILNDGFLHDVLSNTLQCGHPKDGQQGIPARFPAKWLNADGSVRHPFNGYPFANAADELSPASIASGSNLTPCQNEAEVTFAMKTGLVSVSGGQVGLVRGLAEKGAGRKYIVAFFSSLGSRFTDAEHLEAGIRHPCFDAGLCASARVHRLGKRIDDFMKTHLEN